jgi:dihydrofolate synthase/folylpolyglutamate synthase
VIGETVAETKPVFEKKAKETNSALHFAPEEFEIISSRYSLEHLEIQTKNKKRKENTIYHLDLNGLYQKKNLLTVLGAAELLKNNFLLTPEKIKSALSKVKLITGLHGRWEIIHKNPTVALDVAHNEDGIKQLLNQIKESTFDNLHIIFGMVKDKDIEKVLIQFPKNAKYYFTKAQIPRALPEDELQQKANAHHLTGNSFPDVNKALQSALDNASAKDLIIVCGSVFVVGEVDLS